MAKKKAKEHIFGSLSQVLDHLIDKATLEGDLKESIRRSLLRNAFKIIEPSFDELLNKKVESLKDFDELTKLLAQLEEFFFMKPSSKSGPGRQREG